jgi:hypothetical protein
MSLGKSREKLVREVKKCVLIKFFAPPTAARDHQRDTRIISVTPGNHFLPLTSIFLCLVYLKDLVHFQKHI